MHKIKKAISYLLIISMIICSNLFKVLALEPGKVEYQNAVSDTQTYDIKSLFNGVKDDDGRIEVDKSVSYCEDDFNIFNSYNNDEFSITLSALGQAYNIINEYGIIEKKNHPDVIFIIDASGSMRQFNVSDGTVTRAEATARALNVAVKELYAEDPETRIGIVTYGFGIEDGIYLPLDKYILPEGQTDYITWGERKVAKPGGTLDGNYYLREKSSSRYPRTVSGIKTVSKPVGVYKNGTTRKWTYYKPDISDMTKITTTESGITYYAVSYNNTIYLFSSEREMAIAFMKSNPNGSEANYTKTYSTEEITITCTGATSLTYEKYKYETLINGAKIESEKKDYMMATNYLINSKGEIVPPSSHSFVIGVGTYTQSGLKKAEDMFKEVGNKENHVPAIVLISDGVPTVSDKNTLNPNYKMEIEITDGYGLSTEPVTSQDLCVAGLRTIETAMSVKNNVNSLYNNENRDALFYTIGPGVDYIFGQTILNPTNENVAIAEKKTTNVGENTESGMGIPSDLAKTIKQKYSDLNYVDYADWSYTGNMSTDELTNAFKRVVTSIIDINRPADTVETVDTIEKISSAVTFVDDIGNGFKVLEAPVIRYGEKNYGYTSKFSNGNSIFYKYDYKVIEESSKKTYNLNDLTVEIIEDNGEYQVKWYIPTELIPLIVYNETENFYVYSNPIRLIYKVGLKDDVKESDNWHYTNKIESPASATFIPTKDNPYYRTKGSIDYYGENRDKKLNETNTLIYTNNNLELESNKIQVLLGNNGKIFVNFTKTEIIPDVIVVDYDKTIECFPLENDIEAERLIGIGAIDGETYSKEIKTQSGVFKIQDSCVLFTPFKYMSEINRVKYYVEAFDINGNKYILFSTIKVIPATTVYYEDNFGGSEEDGGLYIKYTGNWQQIDDNGNKYDVLDANTNPLNRQDRGEVGQGKTPYGYDSHYNNCSQFSNGTATTVQGTVSKDENGKAVFDAFAEFEFTGTGFDIISRTDIDCGMISVVIYDADNKFIDNVPVINKGVDNLYQIPVISYTGIPYNTYKVRINVSAPQRFLNISGSTFYLDAIRIYNPMGLSDSDNAEFSEANEAYYIDKEANENIISIRDVIINDGTSSIENTSGILYVDTKDNSYTSGTKLTKDDIPTFELIGPNEEVYLSPGEGIGFAMRANSIPESVQISAKMPNQNINGEIMINNRSIKINSATEMFYDFTKDINFEKKDGYYEAKILIYNHVKNDEINNIVSLTNIKSTFNEKNTDVIETASLLDNQIELFANEEVFENLCAAIDVKPTSLTMISAPQKVNYNYNEKIDTSGLVMELVYSDGQKQKIYSGYELSSYKANHIGNKTITVKYMNFEVGFRIKTEISLKDIILILFGLGWLVK